MSFVYVIGEVGNPVVKIGTSRDPVKRVKELATGSPWDLRVLWREAGGEAEEAALHRYFADINVRREWFDFTGYDMLLSLDTAWLDLRPYIGELQGARDVLIQAQEELARAVQQVDAQRRALTADVLTRNNLA